MYRDLQSPIPPSKDQMLQCSPKETLTPVTECISPTRCSSKPQYDQIIQKDESLEMENISFNSKSIDESYKIAEKSGDTSKEQSSLCFSDSEQEEPIHNPADPTGKQNIVRISEIQPDDNRLESDFTNPTITRPVKVHSVMKSDETSKWPGMTWREQKELEEKYKKSLIEIQLLEMKACTTQKLLESYKKSCKSLQEQIDEKDEEIKRLKEENLKSVIVQGEVETQTEESSVPQSAYAEVKMHYFIIRL